MERSALQINRFRKAAVTAGEMERAGLHFNVERLEAFTKNESALSFARHIFNLRQFLPECLVTDNPFKTSGRSERSAVIGRSRWNRKLSRGNPILSSPSLVEDPAVWPER